MSSLRMSSVGHLPPEQKLKRGEVLLQYTRVLEQPDYTPVPFNQQEVKTIKCDLTWTFTKLMKKIHKHDGGRKVPLHVRELLWQVEQESRKKKEELEAAKKAFKDRFTGVKGLSRFGHEVKKPSDDQLLDDEYNSDAEPDTGRSDMSATDGSETDGDGNQTDATTDGDGDASEYGDDEDDAAPPPPPPPPDIPAPEDEGEPGEEPGSPEVAEAAAAQAQEEEAAVEAVAEEPAAVAEEEPAADAEEQAAQEEPAAEEDAAPAEEQAAPVEEEPVAEAEPETAAEEEAGVAAEEESAAVEEEAPAEVEAEASEPAVSGFESPTDDPERLAPGHQVLADVTGGASSGGAPPRHGGSRRESGSSDLPAEALGRRKSWVEAASEPQHAMAAAMVARRASLDRSGSVDQTQVATEQAAAGSRPISAVQSQQAAASSRPISAVQSQQQAAPASRPVSAVQSQQQIAAGSRPISAVQSQQPSGSRPISAIQSQVKPADASSRPVSAVQSQQQQVASRPTSAVPAATSSRPTSAVPMEPIASRPISAVRAASSQERVLGSRPGSAVLGSRPGSAVPVNTTGSRPPSGTERATSSRPTSGTVAATRPDSALKIPSRPISAVEKESLEETKEQDVTTDGTSADEPTEHLLSNDGGFHDFDAIRAAQAANPSGGFVKATTIPEEEMDLSRPAILKGSILVDDGDEDEDESRPMAEDDIEREPPRPYGFLPFLKISRNGFTKEVRIPSHGDKFIDPFVGWLREKYRFAAPPGVHAFVTLHAYGYVVYAKNNIRF